MRGRRLAAAVVLLFAQNLCSAHMADRVGVAHVAGNYHFTEQHFRQ